MLKLLKLGVCALSLAPLHALASDENLALPWSDIPEVFGNAATGSCIDYGDEAVCFGLRCGMTKLPETMFIGIGDSLDALIVDADGYQFIIYLSPDEQSTRLTGYVTDFGPADDELIDSISRAGELNVTPVQARRGERMRFSSADSSRAVEKLLAQCR